MKGNSFKVRAATVIGGIALLALFIADSAAQPASTTLPLPGKPFAIVISPDQRWIIVSLTPRDTNQPGSLAVLENQAGKVELRRVVPMANTPFGMALTHDGKLLIVTAQDAKQNGYVIFFDIDKLTTGEGNPRHVIAPDVAYISEGSRTASIYANVTADDKTLFVSNEFAGTISVIDLESLRFHGLNPAVLLGDIPVGISPVALTFSPDGRWLYSTSEVAPPNWRWPKTLRNENGNANMVSEGAVVVVDVTKARSDPKNSVIARVAAGGSPVRLALSPDGSRLFVTARASNSVLTFDAAKLVADPQHARLSSTAVGPGPVPIALISGGKIAVVGNSNRFGANATTPSTLSVLDTTKMGTGENPVIGTILAGAFPREMSLSPDGRTLFLTNYLSGTLQILDVDRISR